MSPEDQNEEEPGERGRRNYWWLALSLMFLLLAGGGYYALTSMKGEAHKLAGGGKYEQYSASAGAASGSLPKNDNYFAAEEADPVAERAAKEATAAAARLNTGAAPRPAPAHAGGAVPGGYAAARGGGERESDWQAPGMTGAQSGGLSFVGRLQARASGAGGAGSSAVRFQGASGREEEPSQTGGAVSARPSAQRETAANKPQKSDRGGVMDALKGAFRASFYGARIASQDAARDWIARSFDASPGSGMSLEYDEKMKKGLDSVDPDSVPKFLRDQDITGAEARTLQASDVGSPAIDKEGTKEALKNDIDYQGKKAAGELAGGMINPLFAGAKGLAGDEPSRSAEQRPAAFASPDAAAVFSEIQLDEYVQQNGYGAECGCTQSAPCCCMPQNAAKDNCPLYGPFLPDDPCGNYSAGVAGDFPKAGT